MKTQKKFWSINNKIFIENNGKNVKIVENFEI